MAPDHDAAHSSLVALALRLGCRPSSVQVKCRSRTTFLPSSDASSCPRARPSHGPSCGLAQQPLEGLSFDVNMKANIA